ncbi:MAG: adenylate kinase [Propionicimonas sp.]|uniref:adenylate kinase n=1 Tax=Propionicimonas sp. TaxID=1955623 RepID=UPI003D14C702
MPLATMADVRRAQRVLLYGVTGSGKSTAALALGARRGLPVHLVDEEFGWLGNWVQRPVEEMRALVAAAASEPEWVFDTAYGSFRDLVEPRAEVVIGLDYPRWLSLHRLLRRTVTRLVDRQPICNGNVETLRQAFSRDSIIAWHFRSFTRKRATMRGWAARADGPAIILLRHARELDELLTALD